jgi:polar amino acid transport system ATP-binding protein
MIKLTNLSKSFGDKTILASISAHFSAGETVSLVGPSGGGKTTLLRCLNGLEYFDSGSLNIAATDVRPGPSDTPLARRALAAIREDVGFVFQSYNLFAHRTVVGNIIEAPIYVQKRSVNEATAAAYELLAKVGMSEHALKYPHELSGGQQQRVAIARALAMRPKVLLMDEPTSALDPERVQDVTELLKLLTNEGLTLVIVTHELGFARAISQRIVVLHSGRIVEEGSPYRVLEHPESELTRAFLGQGRG